MVPDQWHLQKVNIETCSGKKLATYIIIYDENLISFVKQSKRQNILTFQDSLEIYFRYEKSIATYSDLVVLNKHLNGLVCSLKEPVNIELADINYIERIPSELNNYIGGWSEINIISRIEFKLLQQKSKFDYYREETGREFELYSYNAKINRDELIKINTKLYNVSDSERVELKRKYSKLKVVILEFFAD